MMLLLAIACFIAAPFVDGISRARQQRDTNAFLARIQATEEDQIT